MTSKLTVVTGPEGVDIGRTVAAVGHHIDDGLAVRVIDTDRPYTGRERAAHTSPDPYHGHHHSAVGGCAGDGTTDTCVIGRVRLRYLPSAWQNPDTNLGVVFTGPARPLADDIHTMASLGLDPSHRLTVQARGPLSPAFTYPAPIEVGDVGAHARDAVLRAGGHVLIEAGDGMPHLDAIAALRLPPWAPWVGRIELWTVFDVRRMIEQTSPGEHLDADTISRRVADGLTVLGGTVNATALPVRTHVVILGLDALPDVAENDVADHVYVRAAGGVDTVNLYDRDGVDTALLNP